MTVDDVLDHLLPEDWRTQDPDPTTTGGLRIPPSALPTRAGGREVVALRHRPPLPAEAAVPERYSRYRLDTPAGPQRRLRVELDTEAFGRASERLARFLGTGTYLLWQTSS